MAKAKLGYVALREKTNNNPIEVWTYGGREYPTPNGMPSKVTIMGQPFEVRYHSHIYAERKTSQRLRGIVLYSFRLIVLDPKQSIHMMRETLYHEMGHIYLKVWQTKATQLDKLSPMQVEEICDMFAEAHYDALLNAPEMT
jgi:hypothetical protein